MKIPYRTGFGMDVHRFQEGRELWLCGIQIPHSVGLLGHSDADVALHALCDAMLGAAALRDIGYYFPDTDQSFKNIDSKLLLADVKTLVEKAGYEVGNVDITIAAQAPKLSPHIEAMRECVARCLAVDTDQVCVKATTTEHLGFTGRKEGIAAFATVLLVAKI
jgi:2-C-methyl-D-erythritol 2,4-cyclodiphosphate synthase